MGREVGARRARQGGSVGGTDGSQTNAEKEVLPGSWTVWTVGCSEGHNLPSSKNMTVIKAGMGQVEELAELNRQLLADERHPDPVTTAQLTERMASWLQDGYVGYVARRGGGTVGYCLHRDAGRYYYLRQLFIVRAHRRRGLATELLNWMYANVWTGKPVRLDVFAHNEQAVAFYKAYGFRIAVLRMEK